MIYAPLRRAAFVANGTVVNRIADLKEGIYDPAADPGGALLRFLREMEIVDAGPEPSAISEFHGVPEPTSVTLFMTTACNLRCTYCYASAGDTALKFMPIEVDRHGIDFVLRNARRRGIDRIELGFHGGGEPTVNWKVLTEAVAYARTQAKGHGISVHASLATNGVLPDAKNRLDCLSHG